MVKRKITKTLVSRLKQYPAVALIGPRQSGKTTLAQSLKGEYFDLEQESDRLSLDLQWSSLVEGKFLVILDEAQSWPEIFPRLRGAIDQDRQRKGRFLLLGSVSPALMVHVSESLAGRLSLVEITPFLLNELPGKPLASLWCCGGYPEGGILEASRFPQWQRDYLALLSQRDLPAWGMSAKPQVTQRLVKMVAAVHGQIWNASQLGESLGLSYQTVNSYLDYLAGAFLVRRLQSYKASLRKRLVKRPKVFWRDSGLLHALLNVSDRHGLLDQPWVGASWEGFVVEQILGILGQEDVYVEPYYLRTADMYELDLLLDFGKRLCAIEIKLTASPTVTDLSRLNKTADLVKADKRILVSQISKSVAGAHQVSCNLPWLFDHLDVLFEK